MRNYIGFIIVGVERCNNRLSSGQHEWNEPESRNYH